MSERDRLIELISEAQLKDTTFVQLLESEKMYLADYLIAHGVTIVGEKRQKPKTDLGGKCGNCKWAEVVEAFGGSKCYVRCENENAQCNRRKRNDLTPVRQRTHPACKMYERREAEQRPEEYEEAQHD